jgi:hypothetical protein
MSDEEKLGDLVFLDEWRIRKEIELQRRFEESEYYEYEHYNEEIEDHGPPYDAYTDEALDDYHYNYLASTDIATLSPSEVRWIIRHLISRSDFQWRREEAEKMINEILEEREKEDN